MDAGSYWRISDLQEQNSILRDQLSEKDSQIDHLTQLLAMSTKNVGMLTEQLEVKNALIAAHSQSWWHKLYILFRGVNRI
jgi:hypothetical protein